MNFDQVIEQFKKLWAGFTLLQKTSLIAVLGIALFGMTFFVWQAQSPRMEPLYTDLSPENASAISAKLKDLKVDFRLADEGRTIMVPSKDKYQLRLDMAGQVNLNGVVGFESFNETRFGETDTDKRVRFLIALQGELTRTIEQLDEVEIVKVHIALPAPSLFLKDQKDASASVLLRLKPYAQVKPEQVKSIMAFVSSSVEGLNPDKVTVMDVNGNLLSEGIYDNNAGYLTGRASATQLSLKKQYEQELALSVQSMLEKMRGPGSAIVRASVLMDFDQVEKRSEMIGEPVLISEMTKEETSSGSNTPSGENPVDSNTAGPSYGSTGSTGSSEYQLSEKTRNYETSKTVETTIVAPGKVMKVSLSVLIDGDLTTQDQAKITDAVSNAAGIDSERGDQVSVAAMPFNTEQDSQLLEQLAAAEKSRVMMEYIKLALPIVGVIIIALLLLLGLRKLTVALKTGGGLTASPAMAGASSVRRTVNAANAALQEDITANIMDRFRSPNLSPELMEKKVLKSEIDNLAQSKSEEVANVIKTWLVEE